MNPATFLRKLTMLKSGYGFRKIANLDINSLRDADGTILTASTEPSRGALETSFIGVVVSSSQTDLGTLAFEIPRDYDQSVDKLRFRFLVNSGGTTDAPALDAAIYRKRAGAALSGDLGPTISAVITKTSATTGAAWREINADTLSMKPGDALTVAFTVGGTRGTTDAVNIYALEVVYASTLVYYESTERSL